MDFIFAEGIAGAVFARREFEFDEILSSLSRSHGYALKDAKRQRMLGVVLDFLIECEYLRAHRGRYITSGDCPRPAAPEPARLPGGLQSEYDFFDRCIGHAGAYLRGGRPLYDFSGGSVPVWDEFLGNPEFEYARAELIKRLSEGNPAINMALVLCYGPGYDIYHLQRYSEDIRITAVDYNGVFYETAMAKLLRPASVDWIHSDKWDGFGSPLPIGDGYFDAVIFACADPYVPDSTRRFVYEDIFRVLKRRGSLGIITRGYPDAQCAAERRYRISALCHDFAESVCDGWQGFYPTSDTRALLEGIGFDIKAVALNECLWRVDKP